MMFVQEQEKLISELRQEEDERNEEHKVFRPR